MQAISALLTVTEQINHVLSQLEPHESRRQLPEFEGNTLGMHFRHILEFFQCLERAWQNPARWIMRRGNGTCCMKTIRVSPPPLFWHFPKRCRNLRFPAGWMYGRNLADLAAALLPSTVGRELLFVYDHAIHHLAIIKIGLLCHFPHIRTDKDLGVSPSTIKARKIDKNPDRRAGKLS